MKLTTDRDEASSGRNVAKLEWWSGGEKCDDMFSRFDRLPTCDRQTDGQIDRQTNRHLATA